MCCTNQPCNLRGSKLAAQASKRLLDGYAAWMRTLSLTQNMMLVDRVSKESLWDMTFQEIETSMEECIEHIKKLVPENRLALDELYSEAFIDDQRRNDEIYKTLDFERIDSEYSEKGFYLDGDNPIRRKMIDALRGGGDRGGYEVLLQSYEPLTAAADDFLKKLRSVRGHRDWRNSLINQETGLNDAASRLMGRLMTAKATQSAFTGFYMANVRKSEP